MELKFYKNEIVENYVIFSKFSAHLFSRGMIYVLKNEGIFSEKEIDELIELNDNLRN